MYEKLSKYFVSIFSKYDVLDKDPLIYQYGLMISISYFFSSLIIIILGISLGAPFSSILYIYLFNKLREYSGGYHANSYLECSSLFITLFILCIILSIFVPYFVTLIVSSSSLLLSMNLIPTYHPNKKVNISQISRANKIALKRFTIAIFISILFYFYSPSISVQINIIIIEILILIRIQYYINEKRRGTDEENIDMDC